MTPPRPEPESLRIDPGSVRELRHELASLADALVDAGPDDRSRLRARARRAAEAHLRSGAGADDLGRLLRHMLADLAGDAAPLDTLYYARQLAVAAERLPN